MDLQEMQSMVFIHANVKIYMAWNSVVLLRVFVFFHLVVCNCFLAKSIRFYSDIGKVT